MGSEMCIRDRTNALRLNWCRLHDAGRDKKVKHSIRDTGNMADSKTVAASVTDEEIKQNNMKMEDEMMEKTMKIEGMMCGHCEATVKKALEHVEGVSKAVVSHEKGNAVITLSADVSDDVLKKTVEDKDYTVISVE